MSKPELRVTVFSDYICPFCYIGDARLNRLRDQYDLRINWCLLEIHPDTPEAGMPIERLGYPADQWRRMMASLKTMADEDGLPISDHAFTTNSHKALLLAEAAKHCGAEVFYRLHEALFRAFFVKNQNIGEPALLRTLGSAAGMRDEQMEQAFTSPTFEQQLKQYQMAARELDVAATPTFFIGKQRLDGAVPVEQLRAAAEAAYAD